MNWMSSCRLQIPSKILVSVVTTFVVLLPRVFVALALVPVFNTQYITQDTFISQTLKLLGFYCAVDKKTNDSRVTNHVISFWPSFGTLYNLKLWHVLFFQHVLYSFILKWMIICVFSLMSVTNKLFGILHWHFLTNKECCVCRLITLWLHELLLLVKFSKGLSDIFTWLHG